MSATKTSLSTLLIIPTLLILSLPLLPFAFLTTTIALITLTLRAAISYLALANSLLTYIVSPGPPAALVTADYSLKSRPSTSRPLYSFSSSGSVSPRRPNASRTQSLHQPYTPLAPTATSNAAVNPNLQPPAAPGSVTGGPQLSALERDFEGMGGWRDTGDDDDRERMEDALWTGLNSRLELPAAPMRTGSWAAASYSNLGSSWHSVGGVHNYNWTMSPSLEKVQTTSTSSSGSGSGSGSGSSSRQRQHKRSWTSGAVRLDRSVNGRGGQWVVQRPGSREEGLGPSRPGSVGRLSGTMSPEEGLVMATKTKSFTDINARMNVGRVRGAYGYERRKSGSSGSVSSGDNVMITGAN